MAGVKKAKVRRAKAPKVKPVKRVVSKKSVKMKSTKKPVVKKMTEVEKRRAEFTVVQRKEFKTRTYIRETFKKPHILEYFKRRGKKPPIRYRRAIPKGMVKVKLARIKDKKVATGSIIEFKYGYKQVAPQVGGWKNDPRPVLFLFWDDKIKFIEGVNTNYLSEYYLKKVRTIQDRFPGIDGELMYNIFKRTAKYALAVGYRKYYRASFRDVYLYVFKDRLARTLDELAKKGQTEYGVADAAKNAEG